MPADNFALDGDELVACAEMLNSPSPSCFVPTASGYAAYTGRVENYLRIRRNTSANTWQVTAKDGTIYSYTALDGGISSTSFRWYLQSVLDRRGNHVDYAYTCATGEECIISTIKYFNQGPGSEIATITFYDGLRPTSEQLTYATGSGILKNARRLKAIKVAFTSGTVRAYAFSYDTSAATGLSRLTSVQQYGRDADVDANGNVTGTALSPTTMSYSALASGSGYVELEGSGVDTTLARAAHLAGDFNGDGITDRYQSAVRRSSPCIAYPPPPEFHSQALASISTGNGGEYTLVQAEAGDKFATNWWVADFTGDGADDILVISHVCQLNTETGNFDYRQPKLTVYVWNGTGFDGLLPVGGGGSWAPIFKPLFDGGIRVFGDFDGDGKTEFITAHNNLWKNGSGLSFQIQTSWTVPGDFEGEEQDGVGAADVNGDGRTDLVLSRRVTVGSVQKSRKTIYLSTGTSFIEQAPPVYTAEGDELNDQIRTKYGDVNGDGRADLVKLRNWTLLITSPLRSISDSLLLRARENRDARPARIFRCR
jgi:FG-GAP-like repeat